jgi:hypothetical protein
MYRRNLACCSIGKKKVVEAGEIEVLHLAAVNNHLACPPYANAHACSEKLLTIIATTPSYSFAWAVHPLSPK